MYKRQIINTLKLILNAEDFELLNYFTHEEENVRSYTIFKNKSKIVLMDYNINENKEQFNDDLDILNFIKETSKEEEIEMARTMLIDLDDDDDEDEE